MSRKQERKAEATSMASAMTAADKREANSTGGRLEVARSRQDRGIETRSDRELIDATSGADAGKKLLLRQEAKDRLATLKVLQAHRALTEAEKKQVAADTEVLAEAERLAKLADRGRGKWSATNADRMTTPELGLLVSQAARAELSAAVKASGYRMGEAERWEALTTLENSLTEAALTRAVRVDQAELDALVRRIFLMPYGTEDLERREAALIREAERQEDIAAMGVRVGRMPRWSATYVTDAERGLGARDRAVIAAYGDKAIGYKRRWSAYLRNVAKETLRAEYRFARSGQAAIDAAEEAKKNAAPVVRMAAAAATVATVADRMEANGRPMRVAERAALEATLDGLTRRQRAAIHGTSMDYEKEKAKRGAKALAKRWPTLADFRADMRAASRQADRQEDDAAKAYGPAVLTVGHVYEPTIGPITRRMAFYGCPRLPMTRVDTLTVDADRAVLRQADQGRRERATIMAAPNARVTRAAMIARQLEQKRTEREWLAYMLKPIGRQDRARAAEVVAEAYRQDARHLGPLTVTYGPQSQVTRDRYATDRHTIRQAIGHGTGAPAESKERASMREAANRAREAATLAYSKGARGDR